MNSRIEEFLSALFLCIALAFISPVRAASLAGDAAPPVSRADLAWSLLTLEQAIDAAELDGQTIQWINHRFDIAVSRFFAGRNSEAVAILNEMTGDLEPEDHRSPMRDWLRSIAVEIDPRTFVSKAEMTSTLRIRSLYAQPAFPQSDAVVELRLIDADGTSAWQVQLDLSDFIEDELIDARIDLDASFTNLPVGTYRVALAKPGERGVRYHRLFILPEPIDAIRSQLFADINAVENADGSQDRAIRIARDRAALLQQRPSPRRTSEFLADVYDLHKSLEDEVRLLRNGSDPYIMREGDHWRPVATRPVSWPMRVYAPAGLNRDRPLPLVIALHGAGGDENMFHDAYGNGMIQRLADEHRFIVASPLTYPLAGDMTLLGELIDEMQRCYPVDADRVYLLGHSLGAGMVTAALLAMPERIAAASCIAGAGRFARGDEIDAYPPVLVIGAEHDFVIPATRVQQQAEAGIQRGLPVTYRLAEHWGHVLVVGGVLEEVITWLLSHERDRSEAADRPDECD